MVVIEIEDSGGCYGDRRFRWLLWSKKIQVLVIEKEDLGCCYGDFNPSIKALG